MIKRRRDLVFGFAMHPITNGVSEGVKAKMKSIKRQAGTFLNTQRFTTAN